MDIIDIKELKDAVQKVFNDAVQGYKKLRSLNSKEKKLWRKYEKDRTEINLQAYRDACTDTSSYEQALYERGIMLHTDDTRSSCRSEIGIITINGFSGKRKFTARIELNGDID